MKIERLRGKVEFWSTFLRLLRNNKGIETRVLVYVLGAVALMVGISIVMGVYEDLGRAPTAATDASIEIIDAYKDKLVDALN